MRCYKHIILVISKSPRGWDKVRLKMLGAGDAGLLNLGGEDDGLRALAHRAHPPSHGDDGDEGEKS